MSGQNVNLARVIAKLAHAGQKYGTADYFEYHVEGVVTSMYDDCRSRRIDMEVAYLHDVLEDTAVSSVDLEEAGFSSEVVKSVMLLTRDATDTYNAYIQRMIDAEDFSAVLVKFHDAMFNYQNSQRDYEEQREAWSRGDEAPIVSRARQRAKRYKATAYTLAETLSFWANRRGTCQDIQEARRYLEELS